LVPINFSVLNERERSKRAESGTSDFLNPPVTPRGELAVSHSDGSKTELRDGDGVLLIVGDGVLLTLLVGDGDLLTLLVGDGDLLTLLVGDGDLLRVDVGTAF
jgi:hypothetical protein